MRGRGIRALGTGTLLLTLWGAPMALAELKITQHPTEGGPVSVSRLMIHLRKCMGKTTLARAADGTVTIGPVPADGDNRFAEAVREIIAGPAVEVQVGANIPGVLIGGFLKQDSGPNKGKTTGVQWIDLADLEKIPVTSACAHTLCAVLIHELWEVHFAKKNLANDGGYYERAHADAVRVENEVLAAQNPDAHGKRVGNCKRQNRLISAVREGMCVNSVYERFEAFEKVDGTKAWQVFTIEGSVDIPTRSVKSGEDITKVEIETGAGPAVKRIVVTNPDPVVQYFDENGNLIAEYENYPDDPESAPGSVASGANGVLYVVEELKGTVERIDYATGQHLGTISHPQLRGPRGIVYHNRMNQIYVVSGFNQQIVVFEADGTFVRAFTNPVFDEPSALLLVGDGREAVLGLIREPRLYVADLASNVVFVLDLDGNLLETIFHPMLSTPSGLAMDYAERLYISSFHNDRVLILDANRQLETILTADLDGPQGIALDFDGTEVAAIYVASKLSQQVVRYDESLQTTSFGTAATVCPLGMAVIETVAFEGVREEVTGTACGLGNVNQYGEELDAPLLVNGTSGDESLTVAVEPGDPIVLEMLAPTAGGPGKFVVHANFGIPSVFTETVLPASIGTTCFPLLFSQGGDPFAIWNNVGKVDKVGSSTYFDGTPIDDPDRAPATFLDLPTGDPVSLPVGSVFTFQGAIVDPASKSPKRAAATNAVTLVVL